MPHFSNPYFYSDPTHRDAFGWYTFSHLANDEILRRQVPNYFGEHKFTLEDVRLVFSPPGPTTSGTG